MTVSVTREDRYLAKVDQRGPDECWPWLAATNQHGYGTFRGYDGEQLAHRFGFAMINGPIQAGIKVCHTCDNPPCQNPQHWFAGAHADNMADMDAKGRRRSIGSRKGRKLPGSSGESHHNSKLTVQDVTDLCRRYTAGETQDSLSARYGVRQSAISRILRGKTWCSVTGGVAQSDPKRRARGAAHSKAKLTVEQAQEIRSRYAAGGISQDALAKAYGLSQNNVSRIVRGVSYQTIMSPLDSSYAEVGPGW